MTRIEMNLHLRGGQTVTVQVSDAVIKRAPLSGDLVGLDWTGTDDRTALRLREVRLGAVDAITVPRSARSRGARSVTDDEDRPMPDILTMIDAVIRCQWCAGPLGDSPSGDFCCQDHQMSWHADRADRLDSYREPWDDPRGPYRLRGDAMQIAAFRLPRQTSNLRADRTALRRALRAATTEDQMSACALRAEQLKAREVEIALRQMRAFQPAIEVFTASALRAIGEALDALSKAFRSIHPGGDPRPRPTAGESEAARRAHALAVRRNRNTGPGRNRGRPTDFRLAR